MKGAQAASSGAYVLIWWHGTEIEAVGPFASRSDAQLWTQQPSNRWIVDQDLSYRIIRMRKRRARPTLQSPPSSTFPNFR